MVVVTQTAESAGGPQAGKTPPPVIVQAAPAIWRGWTFRLLLAALVISILVNFSVVATYYEYIAATQAPAEKFRSGELTAKDKIAVLELSGTIMPPFTERFLEKVDAARKDPQVKGILLLIDSGGGLVADSHEIYVKLQEVVKDAKKPIYVQMKRIAASGGYYAAMGAGPDAKIYAEPTTWTGSIGVIIPRYNVSKLAETYGVAAEPLKTGEFKDALSPFRPLTDNERALWENILQQTFDRFKEVIDVNREKVDLEQLKTLAQGQIFTAQDAQKNGLIDEIGFEKDALQALKTKLGLSEVRVINYETKSNVLDLLLAKFQVREPVDPIKTLLESSTPRAYYYFSWLPPLAE